MKTYQYVLAGIFWLLQSIQLCAQSASITHITAQERQLFHRIDSFMGVDLYDSADVLLRGLGNQLNFQQADYNTYYYHSRQAEVMYYSNLLQLGLQKANRALLVARALQDSVLLLDAYNFLGLFNTHLEKYEDAITFFTRGLGYAANKVPYQSYLALSMPHHIYGNLGEAYSKQKRYQEALVQFEKSLQLARAAGAGRAEAVALLSAAEAHMGLQAYDTALAQLASGLQVANQYSDFDVSLMAYAYQARAFTSIGQRNAAYTAIEQGIALQKQVVSINPFYTLLFVREAAEVYSVFEDYVLLARTQAHVMQIERMVRYKNNQQIEQILATGLANENKLLQLEVQDARQRQQQANIKVLLLLLLVLLLLVAGAYIRYTARQQLKMAQLQNKLSQNLHDDIGASLSSLHIYGDLALQTFTTKPDKSYAMVQQVVQNAKALMENMNDMVWSMKPARQDSMSLATRIKNYGLELLQAKCIDGYYHIEEGELDSKLSYEQKRSLLLIAKEGINNIAKYSSASKATITIRQEHNLLIVSISDNGQGCALPLQRAGNGLANMEARVLEMGGTWSVQSAPGLGFAFKATIPFW